MSSFFKEYNLEIHRITDSDVRLETDLLKIFKSSILRHEEMYPNISQWFGNNVLKGIMNRERVAYLGMINAEPLATAIVKLGKSAKICHLHLDKSIQDFHIGELFFTMMVIDVKHVAKELYFTLPASLWQEKQTFFQSFGFDEVVRSPDQYRSFEEELLCYSDFSSVWRSTIMKLPKIIDLYSDDINSVTNGLLMSIKPTFVKRIFDGNKMVEIRKKFNEKWLNRRVTLYASSPVSGILGYAYIENIINDTPENIWDSYGNDAGCSKSEYKDYTGNNKNVYAIQLTNIVSYSNPINVKRLAKIIDAPLRPPQSYSSLKKNIEWLRAISVAELMQNNFIQAYKSPLKKREFT